MKKSTDIPLMKNAYIRVRSALPAALDKALKSYLAFAESNEPLSTDAPDAAHFKAHHDACKVAIAHIKLLLDLARSARTYEQENGNALADQEFAKLIVNAEKELQK